MGRPGQRRIRLCPAYISDQEVQVRKVLGIVVAVAMVVSLMSVLACDKGGAKGGDPLIGTWAMVDNPGKTVKISKEGEQYFYEGSQGKSPATRQDENTLVVPMGPIEVTVKLDPATGVLTVSFMSETYQYKKA